MRCGGTAGGGYYNWRRRPIVPSVTGTPAISVSRDEDPFAIAIRRPSPRIGRDECPSDIRVVNPGAVEKWIPSQRSGVRTPAVSAAGYIGEAAIVVQVGKAVVDAGWRLGLSRIAIAVFAALFVPIIVGRGLYVPGEEVAAGV